MAELTGAGADTVLPDLTDTDDLMAAISLACRHARPNTNRHHNARRRPAA
jgi:hypothetical protein